MDPILRLKTARTLKWNTIDKFASQLLYAVTGIVLANVVSQEEFGIVGAILVFQSIATLFVDSGFSNALIQRKSPTDIDYSTVFWFNLAMSVGLYLILFAAAPLIDNLFHAGGRLVPLSRVMFVTFILNAASIVQANRLIKQMNVRMVAVSDIGGLMVSCVLGLVLALNGYGAWALVWQAITLAAVKGIILWSTTRWVPMATFSFASLKSIFKVGSGVMASAMLNVVFQNIYSFIIGFKYNLTQLGCYTQADKWSKMGVAPLSSILTSTFLPILSDCQDSIEDFHDRMRKVSRLSAYLYMPTLIGLAVVAPALFHVFFGTKWDNAVILFQLLCLRGIFTVATSIYNNYILATGKAARIVESEAVKDGITVVAILLTVPLGVTWLVVGQLLAGAIYWLYAAWLTSKVVKWTPWQLVRDGLPYVLVAGASCLCAYALNLFVISPWILLPLQVVVIVVVYVIINALRRSVVQQDIFNYIRNKYN